MNDFFNSFSQNFVLVFSTSLVLLNSAEPGSKIDKGVNDVDKAASIRDCETLFFIWSTFFLLLLWRLELTFQSTTVVVGCRKPPRKNLSRRRNLQEESSVQQTTKGNAGSMTSECSKKIRSRTKIGLFRKEPKDKKVPQCFLCQKYGHAQRNCNGATRCVKCDGLPREEDAVCVNCEEHHSASYRG